jgi:hypothetical protein
VSQFIASSCDLTLSKTEDSRRTEVAERMQNSVRVDHSTQLMLMQLILALSSLKRDEIM